MDSGLFEPLVRHIRAHGYQGRFYQRPITYYDEAGLVYWTMGAPIEKTTIINRCVKESTFEYRAAHGQLPGSQGSSSMSEGVMPTRIGVLSDSHGAAGLTRRAVAALVRRGATMFIHCGDIETPECLEELAGLDAHIVFGNCDTPASLRKHAESLGLTVHHPLGEIIVDGARIAFTHGHQDECLQRPLDSQAAWLFHGHTHAKCDVILRSTRVVNPGALHNANPFTVALVTPATGEVEFVEIT